MKCLFFSFLTLLFGAYLGMYGYLNDGRILREPFSVRVVEEGVSGTEGLWSAVVEVKTEDYSVKSVSVFCLANLNSKQFYKTRQLTNLLKNEKRELWITLPDLKQSPDIYTCVVKAYELG